LAFPPNKITPKTQRHPNRVEFDSRRLAVVHHRQAVHQETQKLVKIAHVVWQLGAYR